MIRGGEEDSRKDIKTCLKNLKMDDKKANIDTSLAREYLTKYSSDKHGGDPIGQDKLGNKVYRKGPQDLSKRSGGLSKNKRIAVKIMEQLVKNTELLAQLDYLIRGTNPEYTKKVDVPILINSFKRGIHGNVLNDNLSFLNSKDFIMEAEDPISKLGLLANTICHTMEPIKIISSKNTTVLCNIYVDLCIEAGIDDDSVSIDVIAMDRIDKAQNGCVAAVTSKCDIDSAIYTLLSSSEDCKYPWKLHRIFVQESIYEKFKSSLAHQTLNKIPEDYLDLKNNAMDVQMYKEKLLIFDYIGQTSLDWQKPIVSIEGYRTTKELLSLLIKYPSEYLSLWCTDVSTTNEVTSKCHAQLIWINNIADFQGSNMLCYFHYYLPELQGSKPDFDVKSVNAWKDKTFEERKTILLQVFLGEDQQLYINGWKAPSFYEISNGKCISGTAQPSELDYFNIPTNLYETDVIINAFINSLLMGNCIILDKNSEISDESIVETLQKLGVPIKQSIFSICPYTRTYKYKTIVSYFGESFAN